LRLNGLFECTHSAFPFINGENGGLKIEQIF
jgi:hypothetical protein